MTVTRFWFAKTLIAAVALVLAAPTLVAQDTKDLDAYKIRVDGSWWLAHPSGSFNASSDQVAFDIDKDFAFGDYSTFTGEIDWHFTRKQHLTFIAAPVSMAKTATLNRDITFEGVTYDAGVSVAADLHSLILSPGYQWDFIRRKQGYVALVVAMDLLDSSASLTGTGTVNNVSATRTASGSLLAPIPVAGPRVRWYPIHNSSRLSLDGNILGMYFFGYGNFYSTKGTVQVGVARHLNVMAGYQVGSVLDVHGTTSRLGLRLTQTGPVVGLESSW